LLQQGLEIANLLDNTEGMIEAQAMLAFCYRRTGEPDKAFAAVGQAMELAGNSAPTRYTLLAASVFAEMFGQFPDGRSAMQQFVAEYPQVRDRAGFEAIYESFQQQRRA
jgi:predicted ester cyclase